MGINTKCSIRAEFLERWILTEKLISILKTFEPGWELLPNQVGNLSVYTADHEYKGYIDFSDEIFVSNEEDKIIII